MNQAISEYLKYIEKTFGHQPDATELLKKASDLLESDSDQKTIHDFLELGHLPIINNEIFNSKNVDEWFDIIHKLIIKSKLTVGHLINQRARYYDNKICFKVINGNNIENYSYKEIWHKIIQIGQALSYIESKNDNDIVVGIFTENSLRGALIDLSCLSFHFPVVPIPVTTTAEHFDFIINNSEITHLFIGGNSVQGILRDSKIDQSSLVIYHLDDHSDAIIHADQWESFISKSIEYDEINVLKRINDCDMKDISTVMYTSGTTDDPKGIVFTQENIISKRFARALALPSFCSNDIFLCFLPLYHTFGRYFELLGSIFWGATYAFAESPYFKSLLKDFQISKPSIFISVPKRWIQLMDHANSISLTDDNNDKNNNGISSITGGNLKFGLSAAGYLDPDVFHFFQDNNINLMSGYGMTESTGGITMTPPDDYQPDSVGRPLPGIDTKIAEDGELLIRGSYVSSYYFSKTNNSTLKNGWFHTGDIFKEKNGHLYIIDRKKEIYKNTRGQTISPQKIENMFQDFDGISSAFLVGDGLEFNTLLIYPDYDTLPIEFSKENISSIREYYSSLVQSVNSFLTPYERVINFAIIKRSFINDEELTQKGTYKRKIIIKNFDAIISPMYQKNYVTLSYNEFQIYIPNWLLREKGVSRNDIYWDGSILSIRNNKNNIKIQWNDNSLIIGNFTYNTNDNIIDLQSILICPELWLGNNSFTDFIGKSVFRIARFEQTNSIKLQFPFNNKESSESVKNIDDFEGAVDLYELHKSTDKLYNGDLKAFAVYNRLFRSNHEELKRIAFNILLSFREHDNISLRLRAIETILPELSGELFYELLFDTFKKYNDEKSKDKFSIKIQLLNDEHFKAILSQLGKYRKDLNTIEKVQLLFIQILLPFVADYGIYHPTKYIWARSELYWWQIVECPKRILSLAQKEHYKLINGFRSWIGPNRKLAINRNDDSEYNWKDVIIFDELIEPAIQEALLNAITNTALIKESIFLFYDHRLIELNDINPEGVWVTLLGKNHGKTVLRILVQTKNDDSYNFAININDNHEKEFIEEEIKWLIIMGSSIHGEKFIEEFGGYWPEYNLYTEEYIPGETLSQYLERNRNEIEENSAPDRWQMRWLHFIWSGTAAYINFWWRSDKKVQIGDPSPKNLIIPEHDYTSGTRLISITNREKTSEISNLLFRIYKNFIDDTENEYIGLKRMADWELIFSVIMQETKVKYGIPLIKQFKEEINNNTYKKKTAKKYGLTDKRIDDFLLEVENEGVLTKRMVFAALRYERWLDLNQNATLKARTTILQELYQDYKLGELLSEYPETRVRFFLMTCLKDSNDNLKKLLSELIKELRSKIVTEDDLQNRLHHIHENIKVSDEEKFFLTHLVFKHLAAADYIELVTMNEGDNSRVDLVMLCEDKDGNGYRIRPPFHPKEIARFHSILIKSNLEPIFQGDHEFLLIFDIKDRLVGGVYWKKSKKDTIAHFEWIVIRSNYRKKDLSNRLMDELFIRLKNKGIQHVIAGFFQEEFFYKHGFKIDRNFGGLVKNIAKTEQINLPV
ncbi:MAG: GNAT family N-acetyltransferase [Candidatus Neomarinimicrobiota bacterium]|nr:GNAT family N-acetyltransferase [Candidatus Neomarinimicrobiota bacterium]